MLLEGQDDELPHDKLHESPYPVSGRRWMEFLQRELDELKGRVKDLEQQKLDTIIKLLQVRFDELENDLKEHLLSYKRIRGAFWGVITGGIVGVITVIAAHFIH